MTDQVSVMSLPDCDLCQARGRKQKASYDGKTQMGPWAYMCGADFKRYGVGLGTGKGQRLVLFK